MFVFHNLTFLSLFVLGSVFSQAMKKWVQGSSDQVRLREARVFLNGSAGPCMLELASLKPPRQHDVCALMQAQEEMAWQIAKMIVNDVVSQSNHCSPIRSTKVHTLRAARLHVLPVCPFFKYTLHLHISIDEH